LFLSFHIISSRNAADCFSSSYTSQRKRSQKAYSRDISSGTDAFALSFAAAAGADACRAFAAMLPFRFRHATAKYISPHDSRVIASRHMNKTRYQSAFPSF